MIVLWIVLAIIVVLLIVLVVNASRVKPTAVRTPIAESTRSVPEGATDRFRQILRMKTVWGRENPDADHVPFDEFEPLLEKLYPHLFETCDFERVEEYGLLFKWNGTNPDLNPAVFMAHYDVVEADPTGWDHDPFGADMDEEGRIWARGAVDNKALLVCLLESAEQLIAEGYKPQRTVYIWSGNCEEDSGESTPKLVELFQQRGITPLFVMDEGGAVIDNPPLGVKNPMSVVGVSEKGIFNALLTVSSEGGHASTPAPTDAPAKLVSGLNHLLTNPPKGVMNPALTAMLRELSSYTGFAYKIIFGNLWLFKPVVMKILTSNPETAAMVRTTFALTELEGSPAINVIPKCANAAVNVRVLPGDTIETASQYIKDAFNGDVELKVRGGGEATQPSPISSFNDDVFDYISAVSHSVYPDAGVTPYVQNSSTDARHFAKVFPSVYRYAGIMFRGESRTRIHGQNEFIYAKDFERGVVFYMEFMANLSMLKG